MSRRVSKPTRQNSPWDNTSQRRGIHWKKLEEFERAVQAAVTDMLPHGDMLYVTFNV